MNSKITTYLASAIFLFLASCSAPAGEKETASMKDEVQPIAIAIHGGAGNLKKLNLTPGEEEEYKRTLEEALVKGNSILSSGGKALDAVEAAIHVLEDSPLFNAGKGAVFTHDGTNELDASIMDGSNLLCGAIAGVKHIQNPISLARAVMEKSDFVFLSGKGAEQFAASQGIPLVDSSYFYTENRWKQLQENLREDTGATKKDISRDQGVIGEGKFGTVGCVALDKFGNIAAGTSTGGTSNKRYGRIGDSPVIGAGTYADNLTCAVSCTGKGEDFIRHAVAYDISAQMRYSGISLDSAVYSTIHQKLKASGGRGGCIALDRKGNVSMQFTTTGMYRGYIVNGAAPKVMIYREPGDTLGVR